jgi:hypothetical protein
MVDFGMSKSYMNKTAHVKPGFTKYFAGNIYFASKYAFSFKEQSRRDDLISLTYLLIYLYMGKLEFLSEFTDEMDKDYFLNVGRRKQNATMNEICSGKAVQLKSFADEVDSYSFS